MKKDSTFNNNLLIKLICKEKKNFRIKIKVPNKRNRKRRNSSTGGIHHPLLHNHPSARNNNKLTQEVPEIKIKAIINKYCINIIVIVSKANKIKNKIIKVLIKISIATKICNTILRTTIIVNRHKVKNSIKLKICCTIKTIRIIIT